MKKMLRINNNKMTVRVTETVQKIPEESLIFRTSAYRARYRKPIQLLTASRAAALSGRATRPFRLMLML